MEYTAYSIQDMCSYTSTIICTLRSGRQLNWCCGDKDAKRMVDFKCFVCFFPLIFAL